MKQTFLERLMSRHTNEKIDLAIYLLAVICTSVVFISENKSTSSFVPATNYCTAHPHACVKVYSPPKSMPQPQGFYPELRYKY